VSKINDLFIFLYMKALGIDIGGSAIKGAIVNTKTGLLVTERFRIETTATLSPLGMAKAINQIAEHFKWKGPIGIGFPGVIHGNYILTSANLHPGFINCNAVKLFSRGRKKPVALTNDAAAAALAEMTFGRGKDFKGKVILLTLGTGVGSSLAYRGQVVPLELGHLLFEGKDAEKSVASSVRKKKNLGWKTWGVKLGAYLKVLEDAMWPELIIIGGGVSSKHDRFFKYLKTRAKVVPAKLYNEAGIVGAALWAVQD
jgi:polyphosphate glucokinase